MVADWLSAAFRCIESREQITIISYYYLCVIHLVVILFPKNLNGWSTIKSGRSSGIQCPDSKVEYKIVMIDDDDN
jgi:hypothetical protein